MADGQGPIGDVQIHDLAHATFPFDLGTPASVFLKVEDEEGAFLLESVEGGETLARYSFVGWDPLFRLTADDEGWTLHRHGESSRIEGTGLPALRPYLQRCDYAAVPGLPPFVSGLVGYLGYDMVRAAERLPYPPPDDLGLPAAHLVCPGVLYALDHATNSITVLARGDERFTARDRLERGVARLRLEATARPGRTSGSGDLLPVSNMTADRYQEMVRRAQEHIRAGDIFQVVLSQRLCRPLTSSPFDLYRALRRLNPSPYMFFLRCPSDLNLIGSSPEMFVRLRGDVAEQRPLAGTRRRGRTAEEDAAFAADLRSDAKERAEHVMLVDLARNDLGRVCRYGPVAGLCAGPRGFSPPAPRLPRPRPGGPALGPQRPAGRLPARGPAAARPRSGLGNHRRPGPTPRSYRRGGWLPGRPGQRDTCSPSAPSLHEAGYARPGPASSPTPTPPASIRRP